MLVAGGVLYGTVAASTEVGAANACDWTIVSETGDRSVESREEVEERLHTELAIKLRQFDACTEHLRASQGKAGAGAAGGSGAATGGTGALAPGGGERGADAGASPDQVAQGATDAARDSVASIGREQPEGHSTVGAKGRTDIPQPSPGRVEQGSGSAREPLRQSSVEDDVARILREAAEKETNPERRAALWEEYENYVKNL